MPTLAVIGLVASALLFAALAGAALGGDALPRLDRQLAAWLATQTGEPLRQVMQQVSDLHAPRGILAMTAIAVAVLLWRRDLGGATLVLVTVLGGATLNHVLKHGFQRARPGAGAASLLGTDFSFPSGHVANATLLYGVLAVCIVCRLRTRAAQVAVVLGAAAIVCLVAASRMVLGAHYLSDVLAGGLVGVAWLSLCLLAATGLERGNTAG